jgi:hypothetical protein
MILYLFELLSGVETIFEIDGRVGVSGKAKGASEAFAVKQPIVDRHSETETDDILRWESGRARVSARLLA